MTKVEIYFDNDEMKASKPLKQFIMFLLLEYGIAGATSFKGDSGFGRHQRLKQPSQQFSFDETPMLITFTDEEKKVKEVLTELRKQYRGGFITTCTVDQW